MLDRKSSIESEPRTLNFQQFKHAREAALYVLRTKSVEDALRFFMKGLEDGKSKKSGDCEEGSGGRRSEVTNDWWCDDEECLSRRLPLVATGRDILSAPF